MSAHLFVELWVEDPRLDREHYAAMAGRTDKKVRTEPLATSHWEVRHGDDTLTSGPLVRVPGPPAPTPAQPSA